MKALQRLERDRGADQDRPLRDEVLASEATHSRGRAGVVQLLLGTSVGVILASALVGAWWFISPVFTDDSKTGSEVVAQATPAAAPASVSAAPTTTPSPQVPTTRSMELPPLGSNRTAAPPKPAANEPVVSPPQPRSERVAALNRPAPARPSAAVLPVVQEEKKVEPARIEAMVPEPPPVVQTKETAEETRVADLSPGTEMTFPPIEKKVEAIEEAEEIVEIEDPPPAPNEVIEEEVVKVEAVVEEKVEEAVDDQASAAQGMTFPEFFVKKTVWHPRSDQRVAYVAIPKDSDPKSVREGDTIESLEVLTIEPAAVVLGRDGVEVRKRVGEE